MEADAGVSRAGAVIVAYGHDSGIGAGAKKRWSQATKGVPGKPVYGDRFGDTLAAGDFDGDGYSDLAIGAQWEDIGPATDAGAITVLYGSASGLTAARSEIIRQGAGAPGQVEDSDYFGAALAAGDFNGDGRADLAIGAPGEDLGHEVSAGVVSVLLGGSKRLGGGGRSTITRSSPGMAGSADAADNFGAALATGNFGKGLRDDLAVGAPGELVVKIQAGAVHVLYGAKSGLKTTGSNWFHQGVAGIADAPEIFDRLGSALAAGDFGRAGQDDLAVGVPGEDLGSKGDAGIVHVLYGGDNGVRAAKSQLWHQNRAAIDGSAETGDRFGDVMVAGDIGSSPKDDLAITASHEALGQRTNAGVVHVLFGAAKGLGPAGGIWHQDRPGVQGKAQESDGFGDAMAIVNVVGTGRADLVVGIPGEPLGLVLRAGAVLVLPGGPSGLSAAGDVLLQQSVGLPGAPEHLDQTGDTLAAAS
jgi:hypothetical protein